MCTSLVHIVKVLFYQPEHRKLFALKKKKIDTFTLLKYKKPFMLKPFLKNHFYVKTFFTNIFCLLFLQENII